jgi:hypothetical protein
VYVRKKRHLQGIFFGLWRGTCFGRNDGAAHSQQGIVGDKFSAVHGGKIRIFLFEKYAVTCQQHAF